MSSNRRRIPISAFSILHETSITSGICSLCRVYFAHLSHLISIPHSKSAIFHLISQSHLRSLPAMILNSASHLISSLTTATPRSFTEPPTNHHHHKPGKGGGSGENYATSLFVMGLSQSSLTTPPTYLDRSQITSPSASLYPKP